MNLEPIMQELLGDASSIVAAYQQAKREQERFIKVQIAVAQALNQVGTAAGIAEDKIEEMSQRVIGSTAKMNEVLGNTVRATKQQIEAMRTLTNSSMDGGGLTTTAATREQAGAARFLMESSKGYENLGEKVAATKQQVTALNALMESRKAASNIGETTGATRDQLRVVQSLEEKAKQLRMSGGTDPLTNRIASGVADKWREGFTEQLQKKRGYERITAQLAYDGQQKWSRATNEQLQAKIGSQAVTDRMATLAQESWHKGRIEQQRKQLEEEHKKSSEKGGRGFGRWWAAGAAMQIGSQLGPVGTLGGDIIGGALIGGPAGAGIGAIVGVVQIGITKFKEFADIGHTTLLTVASGAEYAAMKFVHLSQEMIKAGAEMQLNRVKFEVLAQDRGKGQELFSGILGMSQATPFSPRQLSEVTEMLLGMGSAVEDVLPTMKVLGDLAAGDSDRLVRLARVLEQVRSEGRITGFRLRALANLGIGSRDIAQTMGIPEPEAMSRLKEGRVGSNVLDETFNRLVESGGRFFNMTEKSLGTVSGQWDRLNNIVDQMKGKIGESLLVRFDITGKMESVIQFLQTHAKDIEGAFFAVWDRIEAAANVLWDSLKAGMGGVFQTFGLASKSFEDMLPSVEQVKSAMKSLIDMAMQLSEVLLTSVRAFIEMKMLSFSIDVALMRVASFLIGKEVPETFLGGTTPGLKEAFGIKSGNQSEVKKVLDSLISFYDQLAPKITSALDQAQNASRRGLEGLRAGIAGMGPNGPGAISGIGSGPNGAFAGFSSLGARGHIGDLIGQGKALAALAGVSGLDVDKSRIGGIPITPKISPDAQHLVNQMNKKQLEGITPFEKFQRSMELIDEAMRGPNIMGPPSIVPSGMMKKLQLEQFGAFQQLQSGYKGPEQSLSAPTFAGSAAAIDIMNKSDLGARTIQEQIRDVLMDALNEEKEHNRILKEFKDSFDGIRDSIQEG